jgi:uncharacterized membrane-anchored protein
MSLLKRGVGVACAFTFLLLLVSGMCRSALADDKSQSGIEWHSGPYSADLNGMANLKIPEGFVFADGAGTRRFLELTENTTNGHEVGMIMPGDRTEKRDRWFVTFEFSEVGFVSDSDKKEIKADAILKNIQEATDASNEERKKRGWAEMHVLSWVKPPFYDDVTHNLTWASLGEIQEKGKTEDSVNYATRILGRRGTMNIDLVMGPESMDSAVPQFQKIMQNFAFQNGHRYVDFIKGDKVAGYGLTALIAGGATAAVIKTGLFAKFWKLLLVFWKFIALSVVTLFGAIRRFFGRLFKKNKPAIESDKVASRLLSSSSSTGSQKPPE